MTPLSNRPVILTRRLFLIGYVIPMLLVAGAIALGYHANQERITDIQNSRVESCRRTYEGVREVFKPFLAPALLARSDQRARAFTFNVTVDQLKHNCVKQTNREEK